MRERVRDSSSVLIVSQKSQYQIWPIAPKMIDPAWYLDFFQLKIILISLLVCFLSIFFQMVTWIIPKTHFEIIVLNFHHNIVVLFCVALIVEERVLQEKKEWLEENSSTARQNVPAVWWKGEGIILPYSPSLASFLILPTSLSIGEGILCILCPRSRRTGLFPTYYIHRLFLF